MAGGKDQKDANNMLRDSTARSNAGADTFAKRNEGDLNASRGRADDVYGSLRSGYQSLYDTADQNQVTLKGEIGGGGGGGGGGVSVPTDARFGEAENTYRSFMNSGGWSPGREGSMNENITKLKGLGYDPTSVARMQGGGVYDEFARTGGLSDSDRGNIRSRATSVIPSFYGRMRDEANRYGAIQGGYGPGRQVMASRLARQQSGAGADAALNAELGIMDQVRSGRQWGAQGMSESELGLNDLRANSLGAASGIEQNLVDSQNRGRMWGTQGLESRAESDRSAQMSAMSSNASAGAISSAAQAANDRWNKEFGFQQRTAGLEGLGSLYSSVPEEYMANKNFDLANRGLNTEGIVASAGGLKTGNKSWMDYAAPLAGAVAGGFAGGS